MSEKVLITGVSGQDGSYLAELHLARGDRVTGLIRRSSTPNVWRLKDAMAFSSLNLVTGDLTDAPFMHRLIGGGFDRVYNLAAQSHVGVSFDEPSHSGQVTFLGALNCLEAIRAMKADRPRFYQASSSEMFGSAFSVMNYWDERLDLIFGQDVPEGHGRPFQDEHTLFSPNSPYAVAKLAAHHAVRVYREAHGLHACSGILFNHESPRRSEAFVTMKIASYVRALRAGPCSGPLRLGNLDAMRDWGHAADYVRAMALMLDAALPADYVVSTGEAYSVREFCEAAFSLIGEDWRNHVVVDQAFYRPCEVPYLRGDSSKARRELGWSPKISFRELVEEMVGN